MVNSPENEKKKRNFIIYFLEFEENVLNTLDLFYNAGTFYLLIANYFAT